MTKNNIAREQNSEPVLRFLKARTVVYRKANLLVGLQILLTAVVPVLMAVAGIWLLDWKSLFALAGLSIALVDMLIIDRRLGKLSADAAKLAEEFDCRLFSLPWSDILVGQRLSPEAVQGYVVKFSQKKEPAILNWYPEAVSTIPHHLPPLPSNMMISTKRRLVAMSRKAIILAVAVLPVSRSISTLMW